MPSQLPAATIWIEAEHWAIGEWTPDDCNADVIVTLPGNSRWVATFFTYRNIQSLAEKNRGTGECLRGAYFWASDMLLIDRITRERVTEVVADLLASGEFDAVFRRAEPDQDEP